MFLKDGKKVFLGISCSYPGKGLLPVALSLLSFILYLYYDERRDIRITTARGSMAVLTTGINPTILTVTILAKIKNDIVMCTIWKVS